MPLTYIFLQIQAPLATGLIGLVLKAVEILLSSETGHVIQTLISMMILSDVLQSVMKHCQKKEAVMLDVVLVCTQFISNLYNSSQNYNMNSFLLNSASPRLTRILPVVIF